MVRGNFFNYTLIWFKLHLGMSEGLLPSGHIPSYLGNYPDGQVEV